MTEGQRVAEAEASEPVEEDAFVSRPVGLISTPPIDVVVIAFAPWAFLTKFYCGVARRGVGRPANVDRMAASSARNTQSVD